MVSETSLRGFEDPNMASYTDRCPWFFLTTRILFRIPSMAYSSLFPKSDFFLSEDISVNVARNPPMKYG